MVFNLLSSLETVATAPAVQVVQAVLSVLALLDVGSVQYPQYRDVYDGQTFDYIVVGAGSAGCVVANRLTEDSNVTVLLIEAGDDPPIDSDIPALFPLTNYPLIDWGYYSVNDGYASQAHKTKTIHLTRGKLLGGTSSINYLFYTRGNKADYDAWASRSNSEWTWDNVLPYFKKSEGLKDEIIINSDSAQFHNTEGPLGVTRPVFKDRTEEFFKAFEENDRDILVDYNGKQQIGYTVPLFTAKDGLRQSTAVSFLRPAKDRTNLYILKNTLARKIIFNENLKATGVEIKLPNKDLITVNAEREIILSAGTFNSPQILMLSGIGSKEHLDKMNITVLVDAPNVGENLQDHMMSLIVLTGKKDLLSIVENIDFIKNINAFPNPTLLGHIALDKSQTYPDYQIQAYPFPAASIPSTFICSQVFGLDEKICPAIASVGQSRETLYAFHLLLHPESRGRVKLRSSDPEDKPLIYLNYYANEADLEKHALAIEDYLTVINTTYFRNIESEIVDMKLKQCEHLEFGSHEYWKCQVLNTASSSWHYVGTCAMGPVGEGVVDERLRVRGVKRLRVVDASIMPTITSGNTNVPVIMIAEKASDMIKNDNH